MKKNVFYSSILCTLLFMPTMLSAATAYIDDNLMVGLHRERSVDSVIIRLIPSGTPVEVLQAESNFTEVRDPDGISGWVDNQYLVNEPPAKTQLQQAQTKIEQLENELSRARLEIAGLDTETGNTNTDVNDEALQAAREKAENFEQQYNSEKLRVGELQAEIASLKNRLSEVGSNADRDRVDQLMHENEQLKQKLVTKKKTAGVIPDSMALDTNDYNWQQVLIILGITLVIGFLLGLYVLDMIVRRRHGGFRV